MKFLRIIFILTPVMIFSQEFDIKGSIEATAILSNENENPFWFHTNTNYAVGEHTNLSATGQLTASLNYSSFKINAGAAVFGRDGIEDALQRKELYLQFENSWLLATLGAKSRPVVADGLSATNKNFLWSGNARPLPGILLEANEPIKISETFGIDWGIAHYELNDDRFVDNTHLHYKRLGLITTFNENHKLIAQIQHFAQWGGSSPEYGELKDGVKDFVNVFFARNTEEIGFEGETINKLGNHLGSYLLDYKFKNGFGEFSAYHEHPFDDGSGTRLANFPDGVWGVFYKPSGQKIISSILYEYITTTNQSGISVGSGYDNYFNNNVYRSGWTYEGNIIGLPFMITKDEEVTEGSVAIVSNSLKMHHFGIAGSIRKIDWVLKTSYVKNLGRKASLFENPIDNLYNYISIAYKSEKLGTFKIMGGVDFSNVANTLVGGGVEYSYTF